MQVGCGVGCDRRGLKRNQPEGLRHAVSQLFDEGLHEDHITTARGTPSGLLCADHVGDVSHWDIPRDGLQKRVNLAVTGGTNPHLVIAAVGASVLHLDDVMLLAGEFATDEARLPLPRGGDPLGVVLASDSGLATVGTASGAKFRPCAEGGELVIAALDGAPELAQESSQTGLPRGF